MFYSVLVVLAFVKDACLLNVGHSRSNILFELHNILFGMLYYSCERSKSFKLKEFGPYASCYPNTLKVGYF